MFRFARFIVRLAFDLLDGIGELRAMRRYYNSDGRAEGVDR